MTETPKHSVSVAGVVINDSGQVLVIRRADNGHWEPPGGILELEESIDAGVKREIYEETGINVEVGPLTGIYKNMPLGVVALVFRCTSASGSPASNPEASEVQWIDVTEATSLMAPTFAIRVHDAINYSGDATVRAHDGRNLLGGQLQ